MAWVRDLPVAFRQRLACDPNNLIDLYSLMGTMDGLSTDLSKLSHEKNYRAVNHSFRRAQADLGTAPIEQLNLHVSTQCNLACEWCPRQTGQVKAKPDMKVDVLLRALEICPSIKYVGIAGLGEPLLCSNLGDIVTEAKRRQLQVNLITNGVLLADYAKVLRAWGLDAISVSLNAATAESHKRCNGSDTWKRVIAGVQEAVKLFPQRVSVSMVCHRENVDEMGPFLDLATRLGVPFVDFLTLLPTDGCPASDHWEREITQTQQHKIDALRKHPEAGRVTSWPMVRPNECPRACQSPYVSLSVDSEGSVSPCRRIMPPDRKWGTLGQSTLPWKSAPWYTLRAALEGDRELPDCCRLCFGAYTG